MDAAQGWQAHFPADEDDPFGAKVLLNSEQQVPAITFASTFPA
jgi:hypothetical protein